MTCPSGDSQSEASFVIFEECGVEQGIVFRSSGSQAIWLPRTVALPEGVKIVNIVAIGRTRVISPAGESWDSWFEAEGVTSDFMTQRDQPEDQERNPV